jgi:hypothetical protein
MRRITEAQASIVNELRVSWMTRFSKNPIHAMAMAQEGQRGVRRVLNQLESQQAREAFALDAA